MPWLLIFLIFTDTSCVQITQYFLPVKILCISKKKKIGKHWILFLYSKYRFEFSCGAKFAGSEKRIEWEINKKSRGAIENWFSRRKRKRRDRISKNSTDRMIMTREYVHIVNCIPLRLTGIKSLLQCYSLSVDVFNGVLQKAFIRENYVSILFLLFFPSSYSSTRGGGNNTFIELQPQPLSGGDQALRVHTFFVFSRASIINFANYREPRFCLLSCLVLKSKDSLGRACSIFFSKIGTNKIEEESYLFWSNLTV